MLLIRETQLEAFEAARREPLAARIAERIARELPDDAEALRGDELLAFARHGCTRAARWNLRSDGSAFIVTVLALALGPRFDDDPRFTAVLSTGSEAQRVRAMLAAASPEVVNDLRAAAGDPGRWPELLD